MRLVAWFCGITLTGEGRAGLGTARVAWGFLLPAFSGMLAVGFGAVFKKENFPAVKGCFSCLAGFVGLSECPFTKPKTEGNSQSSETPYWPRQSRCIEPRKCGSKIFAQWVSCRAKINQVGHLCLLYLLVCILFFHYNEFFITMMMRKMLQILYLLEWYDITCLRIAIIKNIMSYQEKIYCCLQVAWLVRTTNFNSYPDHWAL